jgi:hypothetical protein
MPDLYQVLQNFKEVKTMQKQRIIKMLFDDLIILTRTLQYMQWYKNVFFSYKKKSQYSNMVVHPLMRWRCCTKTRGQLPNYQ